MSNNYNKLYKLVENLKYKISKLDDNTNKAHSLKKNNINYLNCRNDKNLFLTYKISSPYKNEHDIPNCKRFIGLQFSNLDDSSDYNCSNDKSFIQLKKSNCIINYSIQIDVVNYLTFNNSCSISLGIREKDNSKIRIIKGSKNIFDLLNNKITVNSTILYNAENGDELCIIAEINNKVKINPHKSIIKILLLS
jgi:hypothetical protein